MFSHLLRILPQLVKDRKLCPSTEDDAFLRKFFFSLKTSGLTMFNKSKLSNTIAIDNYHAPHLYVEKNE